MNAKSAFEFDSESVLSVSEDDAPIIAIVQSAIAQQADQSAAGQDEVLTLALDDLLADENGEIVLFNDSNMRAVAIETGYQIVKSGEAEIHQTISGDDVSGFQYMSFANGTTLYFQDGLNIILVDQA